MERIEDINKRLVDYFGKDSSTNQAMFRVTWADDETEMRKVTHTPAGVELLFATVMEVKKYPYLMHQYVLEQLSAVPEQNISELAGAKVSYEPLWGFHDDHGNPIQPTWESIKFVIDTYYAALGKKSLRKYVESEEESETAVGKELRVTKIAKELFGNETATGDAMAHGEAIVVPNSYENEKVH